MKLFPSYIYVLLLATVLFTACDEDPRCNDGILNGEETAIDCGGNCDPCFSCSDGILNQGEFDVDCGGPCPNACTGQATWEILDFPANSAKNIHFFSANEGILLANEGMWRTNDQGDSWSPINTPNGIYEFQWMRVINDDLAYVSVGQNNAQYRLYEVTNQFNDWTPFGLNLPTDNPNDRRVFDLVASSENDLLLSHEKTFGAVQLTRTRDGGQSWEVLFDSSDFFPFNVENVSSLQYGFGNTIYAFLEREQILSTDDGASWIVRDLPNKIRVGSYQQLATESGFLRFRSATEGYYLRGDGSNLLRTTDGGLSWTTIDFPLELRNGTNWRVQDYVLLADGRRIVTTVQNCDQENTGFCSIAWLSDATGINWERLGITPGFDVLAYEEIMPVDLFFFPAVTFAIDGSSWNENRKFLRLKQ